MADTKRVLLIGCGVLAGLALLGGLAIVGLLWYAAEDVQGVSVTFEQPESVKVGETFDLAVKVTNQRTKAPLKLSDIDIGNDYLAGFVVVATEPAFKSTTDVPIIDMRSFTFDITIPAQQSTVVKFKLKAAKEGLFSADLDINEGARSLSTLLQTLVESADQTKQQPVNDSATKP